LKNQDNISSVDHSTKPKTYTKGISSSKFLQNEEDDEDRLSNITDAFIEDDEKKFIKVYNMQGQYSALQSVNAVFPHVSSNSFCFKLLFRHAA
jgi:hypothetical protein